MPGILTNFHDFNFPIENSIISISPKMVSIYFSIKIKPFFFEETNAQSMLTRSFCLKNMSVVFMLL